MHMNHATSCIGSLKLDDRNEIKSLTSLRGMFMIGICLYHIADLFGKQFAFLEHIYTWGGVYGTDYFFVLAGFFAGRSLKKEVKILEFLFNKIKKWYPLYFVTNVFCLAHCVFIDKIGGILNLKAIALVFLLQSSGWIEDFFPYNVPCWFLCLLLLCHIVHGMISKIKDKEISFLLLIALLLWGYVLDTRYFNFPFSYVHNGDAFFNYFTGAILYEVLRYSEKDSRLIKKIYSTCVVILSSCIILIGFNGMGICGDTRFVITLVILPCVIVIAIFSSSINQILSFSPLVHIGKLSMIIFMIHVPIRMLFEDLILKYRVLSAGKVSLIIYLVVVLVISEIIAFLASKMKLRKTIAPIIPPPRIKR